MAGYCSLPEPDIEPNVLFYRFSTFIRPSIMSAFVSPASFANHCPFIGTPVKPSLPALATTRLKASRPRRRRAPLACAPFNKPENTENNNSAANKGDKSKPLGFILWGPPGSGKTSLCEALSHIHGLVHISTGTLLRAHVLYETELGQKARKYVFATEPIPDDIMTPMILERMKQPDVLERGFLLDGFPRNELQHEALSAAGFTIRLAIMLHAPRETLSRRIRYRRLDPETDALYNLKLRPPASQEVLERLVILEKDSGANVAELFASYGRATADTFELLAASAVRVDADRSFDDVLHDVSDALESYGALSVVGKPDPPPPATDPKVVHPPNVNSLGNNTQDSKSNIVRKPMTAAAALRARKFETDLSSQLASIPKTPITLIRCDGYICERESVEESVIAFRGAATEQVMLVWNRRPQTVLLLVKKDPELMPSVLQAARYLMQVEKLRVIVEGRVQTQALANGLFLETFSSSEELHEIVDFVTCLGGDGLILHVSTLFRTAVPPVISFNLGSLGFLTPFKFENFKAEIEALLRGNCNLSLRMRLRCQVVRNGQAGGEFSVLNEVVVDRGASPYLSNLDCFCDGKYITTVQADGIIMSTPTGSTAYSMSAGGSMVHPSVPAILFTPICPHSLSFRPIVFPDSAELRIEIAEESRSHAWASFDGKSRQQLRRGDGLLVQMNLFPVPTVNKTDHTGDWFQSLDRAFNFNSRAGQKPLRKRQKEKTPEVIIHSDDVAQQSETRAVDGNGSDPTEEAEKTLQDVRRKSYNEEETKWEEGIRSG